MKNQAMWLENDQNSRILLFTILLFFCIFHYLQSLGYFCIIWKFPPFFFIDIVERENSRPITNWHVTLPSPQVIANYKALCIATGLCFHYLETNRNLPSVMQKKQSYISACKRWHKQSSAYKRWHRRINQAMTCVTNQTPPRVAHPSPNSYK